MIKENRKRLMKQQTALRDALTRLTDFDKAIELFFEQHAALHAAEMANTGAWSYPDAILAGLSNYDTRKIPRNQEHSVIWCFWHAARIEDVAMNMLVAGSEQVLTAGNWAEPLLVSHATTGNALSPAEVTGLSQDIEYQALIDYRSAVGRRTREIVQTLMAGDLKKKVDPGRVEKIMAIGAVREEARGIAEYWSKRTIAGLLLMPASRHILVHLNEALTLSRRKI